MINEGTSKLTHALKQCPLIYMKDVKPNTRRSERFSGETLTLDSELLTVGYWIDKTLLIQHSVLARSASHLSC